ncbi:TetR/AcrR family transcriptional regulator [Adhaeribacter aquaticus]|uniref:TetR/AcrR family transcriptional regulator n=1 Tax=Adhaeribacter aquaticus TaxID=299567 RepID=UPI000400D783|nr:TetR/AcrR family transcriptional regulator [Adhaeribacter aquaticus]
MDNLTEKKKAIFESTLELVKVNGFHGTPMSQIAKNAGVAAGTIYHYFESKDALIMELYGYILNQRMAALLTADNEQMEFKERFLNFWISYCNFYIQHPKALFFIEQFVNSPYGTRDPVNETERFQNEFKDFVISGIETGILKPIDGYLLGPLIHGSIVTTAKIHLCRKIELTTNELRQVAEVIWDGIKISS